MAEFDGLEGVTDVEIHGRGVTLDSFDADATVSDLVRRKVAFSDLEVTGGRPRGRLHGPDRRKGPRRQSR